jgi:uncharacterized membrane protein YfcA
MELPHLSNHQWLLAALAALCVGLSKSGLGGMGLLTVLLMAEVMPARESTGVVLPMLICGDVFAVSVFHRHAHWFCVWRAIPPALLGIVGGFVLMQAIPETVYRPCIGSIALVIIALHFWKQMRPDAFEHVPHTRWFSWLMGGASGVTTMMANAAGPLMTIYLLAYGLPKFAFVGTAAWFFFIVNICKLPLSHHLGLINGASLALNLAVLPCVALGIFLGRALINALPQKVFEGLLLLFAALAAVRLAWSF